MTKIQSMIVTIRARNPFRKININEREIQSVLRQTSTEELENVKEYAERNGMSHFTITKLLREELQERTHK